MTNLYNQKIFVPIGDHCAPALILNELELRSKSYPFDWISHVDEYSASSIPIILSLCKLLVFSGDLSKVLLHFLPNLDCLNSPILRDSVRNWIKFPHDKFSSSKLNYVSEVDKYKRRFIRLYRNLVIGSPIYFICISRSYLLKPVDIAIINSCLLAFNPESKFLFITGQHVDPFELSYARIIQKCIRYRENIPPYIEYSDHLFYKNDIAWRAHCKAEIVKFTSI